MCAGVFVIYHFSNEFVCAVSTPLGLNGEKANVVKLCDYVAHGELKDRKDELQTEFDEISQQYAGNMGHSNRRQKLKHLENLRTELNTARKVGDVFLAILPPSPDLVRKLSPRNRQVGIVIHHAATSPHR